MLPLNKQDPWRWLMEKKTILLNIYLKIHQKRDLTMEDLKYLADYDPECFEKTCKNVVYNIPKAKSVILQKEENTEGNQTVQKIENIEKEKKLTIEQILENLKHMEGQQMPMGDVDVERVKNLLGNLYMELLFPHNDKDSFFSASDEECGGRFDQKA